MLAAPAEELAAMDGVGPVIAGAFVDFFAREKNKTALELLLKEVELEPETFSEEALPLSGQSFVITGSLNPVSYTHLLYQFPDESAVCRIKCSTAGSTEGSCQL